MARDELIVVGARCASSPTAMLLAHKGERVLLVDKAILTCASYTSHSGAPIQGGEALV